MRHLSALELEFIYPAYRCLFCKRTDLVNGPRGGIMQNVTCAHCGAQYNLVARDSPYLVRDKAGLITIVPPLGQLLMEPEFKP